MKRDADESLAIGVAFEKELAVVRRLRWPNIKSRQLPMLTAAASGYPGNSPEDQIRALLLDLLDPVEPGKERVPLEERDIKDDGLLGRWIYGQPERFDSPARPDYPYRPAETKSVQRDAELAELRGEYKGALMRAPRGQKAGRGWEIRKQLIADLVDLSIAPQNAVAADIDLADKWRDGSIPRECEEDAIERLREPGRLLVLFGQPGTGKSVLAARVAKSVASRVLVLRASPGRLGESRILEFDLLSALRVLGVDGSTWSGAALEHGFRQALAENPTDVAVLFDDVPMDVVEMVLPTTLAIPVVVTARDAPSELASSIRVDAYSETEALKAARGLFPDATDSDRVMLAARVGRLPVAMFLASKLILSKRYDLAELCGYLLESPVGGIAIIEARERPTTQIVQLYRDVLDELAKFEVAREVLLGACWFSAVPISEADAWIFANEAKHGGSAKYRAALEVLEARGLISRDGGVIAVNDLTRLLVRDLTLSELEPLASLLRSRVATLDASAPTFEAIREESQVARQFMRDLLWPVPWELWNLDDQLWILFDDREIGDPGVGDPADDARPYVSLVEIDHAEELIFEWSSQEQIRKRVVSTELKWLTGMVAAVAFVSILHYEESMRTGVSPGAEWRFPGTSVKDGKCHVPVYFSAMGDGSRLAMTACGRAMDEGENQGDHCPLCVDSSIRRSTARNFLQCFESFTAVIDKFEPHRRHRNKLIELLVGAAWSAGELGEEDKRAWFLSAAARTAEALSEETLRWKSFERLAELYCAISIGRNSHAIVWHLVAEELIRMNVSVGNALAEALLSIEEPTEVESTEA